MRARIILRAAEGAANVDRRRRARRVASRRCCCGADGSRSRASRARGRAPSRPAPDVRPGGPRAASSPRPSPRPRATTHWSRARLAKRVGVSASTVGRVWQEDRLEPHRIETFKYSRDPELVAKVTDVVGPLPRAARAGDRAHRRREDPDPGARPDPADAAAATRAGRAPHPRLQAERHDQPVRGARGRARARSRTRPASGTPAPTSSPSCACWPGRIPGARSTSCSTTCQHPQDARRPGAGSRSTGGSTSTSRPPRASWMNQVETWFGILTRQALRRGSFESVRALVGRDRALHPGVERRRHPVHLGQDRRRDPRQGGAQDASRFRRGTLAGSPRLIPRSWVPIRRGRMGFSRA